MPFPLPVLVYQLPLSLSNSEDFSLHSLHLYLMHLLLGRSTVSPSPSQISHLVVKERRGKMFFRAFQPFEKASEGEFRARASEIGGNQKRVFVGKKKKQKTPTQVHMALPFPLPSCANLDMITSEKSRGGSGFMAEMEHTASVFMCMHSLVLHASVGEGGKKSPPPSHTHSRALQPHRTYSPGNAKFQVDLICTVAQMA